MRIAVVVFVGSAGAKDAVNAYGRVLKQEVYTVWHQEDSLGKPDLVVIPGGASFGDYLRPGALAKESLIIPLVRKFAQDGGPVIGIGNGFQILCEVGILPGILLVNPDLQYLSHDVYVTVDDNRSPFLSSLESETVLKLPLACYYGRYWADKRTIRDLEEGGHVALRYCDMEGDVDLANPFNGSLNAIAGITSRHGNVLGLMPHPERAVEEIMGSVAGLPILSGVFGSFV